MGMIVNGFIEPVTRTLPMEYAVEWSRLIELQMEGSSANEAFATSCNTSARLQFGSGSRSVVAEAW